MRSATEETAQLPKAESDLSALQHELHPIGASIAELFGCLRQKYLRGQLRGEYKPFISRVLETGAKPQLSDLPSRKRKRLEEFARKKGLDWGDVQFHLRYRLKTVEDLFSVFHLDGGLREVIKRGYNLSIMPLNIAIGNKDLLNKFIPKKDFFTDHFAKSWDPYGIFNKGSKIFNGKQYLASQKFKRSVLMNITSACPIGCVGCYKGEFTRITGKRFCTNLAKAVNQQSKSLVGHLNRHSEIKSVIISGGEPLLLSNGGIKKMLCHFRNAKYLAELRICTGIIFQGLPFRIDERLLSILGDFERETGIKINFNAHLSHPAQFSPEALIAIKKIAKKGFPINTQVPLQRNVNIFPGEWQKTISTLLELARLQGASGIRPYKYILHMNVGSIEYSLPLEFMLKVLAELKYRIDHPLPETWQPVSYSILCKQGNILLSPQLLFTTNKKVCKYKDSVEYRIPVPAGDCRWRIVKYVEPLLKGFNDDPDSLRKTKSAFDSALKNKIEDRLHKKGGTFVC
ncbi:MAG: 4Fe-4S cluster-binding domain-containing protein [Candidatus Diapherotrites archaeon]|nr:4Fe-4S cluster-binding domain-containing protein [Candidatus Diapherotrites archaeon]